MRLCENLAHDYSSMKMIPGILQENSTEKIMTAHQQQNCLREDVRYLAASLALAITEIAIIIGSFGLKACETWIVDRA